MTGYPASGGVGGLPSSPPVECDGDGPTPPVDPEFTYLYDPNTDTLTITSTQPVFDTVGGLNLYTNSGSFFITPGQYTQDSQTQLTVVGVSQYGSVLSQVDYYDLAQSTVLYTSFTNTGITPYPIVNSVQAAGPDGRMVVFGSGFINAPAGGVDHMRVYFDDASFVDFYSTTGPNAGLNPPGTSEFTLPQTPDSDSGFTVLNVAELGGKTITSIELSDVNNTYTQTYPVNPPVVIPPFPPDVQSIGVVRFRRDGLNGITNCDNVNDPDHTSILGLNFYGQQLDSPDLEGFRVYCQSGFEYDYAYTAGDGNPDVFGESDTLVQIIIGEERAGPLRNQVVKGARALVGGQPVGSNYLGNTFLVFDISALGVTAGGNFRIEFNNPPMQNIEYINIIRCQTYGTGIAGIGAAVYGPNVPGEGAANAGQQNTIVQYDGNAIEWANSAYDVNDIVQVELMTIGGLIGFTGTKPQYQALP